MSTQNHSLLQHASQSHTVHINEVKITCLGEGLANVKLKWLCFPSSCIT